LSDGEKYNLKEQIRKPIDVRHLGTGVGESPDTVVTVRGTERSGKNGGLWY